MTRERTDVPPRPVDDPVDGPADDGAPSPARRPAVSSRLVAGVVAGAVLLTVGVLRPAIVRGVVGSPRAILIVLGIVAAAVGASALLRRMQVPGPVRTGVLALLLVPVLGLTVAPYFAADEVVDEALPSALPAAATVAAGPTPVVTPPQATPTTQPDAPLATPASAAQNASVEEASTPTEPVPSGPVELSRGTFVGLDGHSATGEAAVYAVDDVLLVRLDDVDLQRVPDAHVYLVPAAGAESPTDGAVYLGPLTGNIGSSNYAVPAGTAVGPDMTVLVWCEAFASPVGGATQSPTT